MVLIYAALALVVWGGGEGMLLHMYMPKDVFSVYDPAGTSLLDTLKKGAVTNPLILTAEITSPLDGSVALDSAVHWTIDGTSIYIYIYICMYIYIVTISDTSFMPLLEAQ